MFLYTKEAACGRYKVSWPSSHPRNPQRSRLFRHRQLLDLEERVPSRTLSHWHQTMPLHVCPSSLHHLPLKMPAPFVPSTYKPPHYDPLHTTSKRPRTALKELQSRFPKPATQTELAELCKPVVPQRTQSNNRWAESVFKKWVTARNSFATVEPFPPDLPHPCGGPGIGCICP